jgi:amino acid adenylation domain-containing protein
MLLPSQVIHEQLAPAFASTSCSEDDLDRVLLDARAAVVDLERGPMLRVLLLHVGERPLLVLSAHAMCADALSLTIVLRELVLLAAGGSVGELSEPLQYADYAAWRHELAEGDDEEAGAARLWSELEELPATPTLLFGHASEVSLTSTEAVEVEIPAAGSAGVPVDPDDAAAFLQAAWQATISRLSGESEIVTWAVLSGRTAPELREAVGPFAGPVPIVTAVGEQTTFAEIADEVRRQRREAEASFDFQPPSVAPVADGSSVGFAYLDDQAGALPDSQVSADHARFALELQVAGDEGLAGRLVYDPSAYTADDAAQIARSYSALLTTAAFSAGAQVASLPLMTAEDARSLVRDRNQTHVDAPFACVHHTIEDRAREIPDAVAVIAAGETMTYRDLNTQANRIANVLRERGVRRGSVVGLCMDRSPAMIATLLGILKAGAAYLPLNFEHPAARLHHQLAEAQAAAVVAMEAWAERFRDFEGHVLCLDRGAGEIKGAAGDDPARINEPGDVVYVMYTSGSTGLPKGVAVTHGNLANYTAHMVRSLGADGERLEFAAVSAISTDLGNTSVFPSLASGGGLHLISPTAAMDAAAFLQYAEDHPLDVLKITPSHLRALLTGDEMGGALPRRWLVLGGEATSWDLVARVRSLGSCEIMNHYGPTETTVGSCTFVVGEPPASDGPTVPIGRPIANTRAYVLDTMLQPVPPGVPGELCIGGAGVSLGYVGRPDLTAAVFVPDPFAPEERIYRTGDRMQMLADGSIEFLGRVDDQVKIRGYRVEPGEVEQALGRHPAVRQAAVVASDDAHGELRLVAYVVSPDSPATDELRSFLGTSLPDYMVPSLFVSVDSLPLTASGKVDRQKLPEPTESGSAEAYVAPETPLEEQLAALFAEVLGVERVGVTANFFDLGGHSLLATQVIARVRSDIGVELPLHSIFISPTVSELAHQVVSLRGGDAEDDIGELLAELESLSDEEAKQALATDERGATD